MANNPQVIVREATIDYCCTNCYYKQNCNKHGGPCHYSKNMYCGYDFVYMIMSRGFKLGQRFEKKKAKQAKNITQ